MRPSVLVSCLTIAAAAAVAEASRYDHLRWPSALASASRPHTPQPAAPGRQEESLFLRQATTASVPPLEWIKLQTTGPAPPQLRDALLGVDTVNNKLLVFGGKSPSGTYSGITYILDMTSMTWISNPTPTNPNLNAQPQGRAQAVGGPDHAASYRSDFIMFGGESASGPLNDIWLYNWNEQFWYEVPDVPNGPSPRWGVVGGTDPLALTSADLSTVLWAAGGSNDKESFALSEVWKLTIQGVLAANSQSIQASWQKLSIAQHQDALVGQGATVMPGGRLVAAGGCAPGASVYNASCATQSAFSLATNPLASSWSAAGACPAARFSASMAPNLNTASSTFTSQAFMLFGAIDSERWSGDARAADGEVAVLDVDQGTWTMVVPAGRHPTPRNGAAIVSRANGDNAADTIIFGGVDEDGNFLNDLWILRAHPSVVMPSSLTWNNITVQYSTSCAKAISPPPSSPGSSSSSSASPTPSGDTSQTTPPKTAPPTGVVTTLFTSSTVHKALSPVSVALLLASIAVYRFVSVPPRLIGVGQQRLGLLYLSGIIGGIAYILGVVGFIISFVTSKRSVPPQLARRAVDGEPFLATGHAKAGFIIFLGLYALIPVIAVLSHCFCGSRHELAEGSIASEKVQGLQSDKSVDTISRALSPSPGPGALSGAASATTSANNTSGSNSFRHLLGGRWKRQRVVSDSELSSPATPDPPVRSFEVVRNHRRSGSGGRIADQSFNSHTRQNPSFSRMLSDINWMERRRSISAVGELDYAMSRMNPEPYPTIVEPPLTPHPRYGPAPSYPPFPIAVAHLALHAFLLAACVFSLIALQSRAPIAAFVVFLVWSAACYGAMFIAAWRGLPRESVLTVSIYRLRGRHETAMLERPGPVPLQGHDHAPSSGSSRGPYTHHQPAYRLAPSHHDDEEYSRRGTTPFPRSSDSDDEDIDDDERQARLEHEMERRNVTIVSVPKPKLFVTNS